MMSSFRTSALGACSNGWKILHVGYLHAVDWGQVHVNRRPPIKTTTVGEGFNKPHLLNWVLYGGVCNRWWFYVVKMVVIKVHYYLLSKCKIQLLEKYCKTEWEYCANSCKHPQTEQNQLDIQKTKSKSKCRYTPSSLLSLSTCDISVGLPWRDGCRKTRRQASTRKRTYN